MVKTSIIPNLVYTDAMQAIDFLCDAFGFTRRMVVPGTEAGAVMHAQLVFGDDVMVMLSTATAASRALYKVVSPAETAGLLTAAIYVVLDDVDGHHAHAAAAGAKILVPPHDNPYGGRSYEVHDTEGNFWSFGSYDPWAATP